MRASIGPEKKLVSKKMSRNYCGGTETRMASIIPSAPDMVDEGRLSHYRVSAYSSSFHRLPISAPRSGLVPGQQTAIR